MADRDSNRVGQPESTVAQSFADDLDSMFGLGMGSGSGSGAGVDNLSQTVEEKKANVTSGQSELQKLEAKLRETEQRLAKVSRQNSPSRQADTGASKEVDETTQRQTNPLLNPSDKPFTVGRPRPVRDLSQNKTSQMPGAMPQTPEQTNGRDDYVMVDNQRQ